ncbi:MAG: hypothetical protein NTW21_36440 [Verrucomicrobia bacterium]|nr:hypothetical protein [Verrucomicrobiota bacterium]
MNHRPIVPLAALLSACSAAAQSITHRVEFARAHYEIPAQQEFQAPVQINPLPAAGLFSYGLICTVEGSGGLVGILTLSPRPTLAFDGIMGAGNRGVAAATGRFAAKGSADMFPPAKPNHGEATLGTLAIAGLPDGTYTLRLANYNTLGPTESVYVDGQCRALDGQLEFGTATLTISSTTEGTLTAVGPLTPDRQTGLLTQEYEIKNTGRIAAVFRILIKKMPAGCEVWNAHGTVGGIPYIDLAQALAPGGTQRLVIEYRSADRATLPQPEFELVSALPAAPDPGGLTAALQPRATLASGNVLLEFNSTAGQSYHIQYTSDLAGTWTTVLPKIVGTGNRIQWLDNGPPKTASHPATTPTRFYRILTTDSAP